MKAMILAAGRGQRMMPLTAHTPKPMLCIAGKPLLQHHIENLRNAGIRELVINHCYLGEQLVDYFKNGSEFGVTIQWSKETTALETAGGIRNALPLLGDSPFLAVNSDIWCDIPFDKLLNSPHIQSLTQQQTLAHLILVSNPPHNPQGDFGLTGDRVNNQQQSKWTFSGVALYHPQLVADCSRDQPQRLAPLLRATAEKNLVSGEVYSGEWQDIGTPQRLAAINAVN